MPKIIIGNKCLPKFEVEKNMRMIYANKEKDELTKSNYSAKILSKEDSDYLKQLYIIADRIKKWSEERNKDDAKLNKLINELFESLKNKEE